MESRTGQTKARFIVIGVFFIGFVAGGLSINLYERLQPKAPAKEHVDPKDNAFSRLNDRLALTPDQQGKVREIVNQTFDRCEGVRSEIEPQINLIRQQQRDQMRAVLTPEQLPKFEEMVKERDSKREKAKEEQKARDDHKK